MYRVYSCVRESSRALVPGSRDSQDDSEAVKWSWEQIRGACGSGAGRQTLPRHHQRGHATADVPQVTDIAVTSRHITSPMAMWLTELLTLLSPLIHMSFLTTGTFTEEDWGLPTLRSIYTHSFQSRRDPFGKWFYVGKYRMLSNSLVTEHIWFNCHILIFIHSIFFLPTTSVIGREREREKGVRQEDVPPFTKHTARHWYILWLPTAI